MNGNLLMDSSLRIATPAPLSSEGGELAASMA